MIQGFLTLTLEGEGFRTSAVGSGSGMFSVLKHEKVDLILLDLGLPDADGLDLTEEIRKTHAVPIIVASARRKQEDRETALELGANDYLTKPFDPRELVERVKFYLSEGSPNARPTTPETVPEPQPEPLSVPQPAAIPDVMRQAEQAPKPARPLPQTEPTSVSRVARESDKMVLLLGILVFVVVLAGGGYWYVERMGGKIPFVSQDTEEADEYEDKAGGAAQSNDVSSRRGALQPPPVDPVRIAQPPKTAITTDKVASKPPSRPAPRPVPENLTESVVVQPQAPPESIPQTTLPDKVSCPKIPEVDWWRVKTHAQVISYVDRKYGGNWQPYVDSWSGRLKKLQDIFRRGSAIKTGNGVVLQDAELATYINHVAERVAAIKCLAEQAMTRRN